MNDDGESEIDEELLKNPLLQQFGRLMEDPIDRLGTVDVHTLNLIGEIALGDEEKGRFTPEQLAEAFHSHLEGIFRNRVCDEEGNRQNMINCLTTGLLVLGTQGVTSVAYPGYISIGTVLVKQEQTESGKAFSFVRHPDPEAIYRC